MNQPANWAEDLLQDAGDIMADQTDVVEELELGTFELPGAVNDRTCPWMIGSPQAGPTVLIAKPARGRSSGNSVLCGT